MKTFLYFLFFVLSTSQNVYADEDRLHSDLKFTNRAQCALDSNKPTENIIVLLSNMDVGRSLYRLAKIQNERDTSEFTRLGLSKYRYTVLSLIELIHQKIITNKLPLLSSDLSQKTNLTNYSEISKKCQTSSRCIELDRYLENLWKESNSHKPNFNLIDNVSKDNFLNIENELISKKMKCSYLKKFTPLEAHLFGTKPSVEVLEQIAKASKEVDQFYSDCHDYSKQESLKVSTYEMSLNFSESKRFENLGFDYWNTLKIYFSWAFRNSEEAAKLAFPFDEIFSSVMIEDSLFMIPNGCKSVVNPKCDPATINQSSIRLFAKHDFKQRADTLDFFRAIPDGAASKIIEDPFTAVNQDILNFSQFESADAWTDSFRQNFSETRLLMRKKFTNSINVMSIMSKNLSIANSNEVLAKYFEPVLNQKELVNLDLKSELYYLCAESTFLSSEELSYIKPKIEILEKLNALDPLTSSVNSKTIIEVFDYYKNIVKSVNALCASFDQSKIFGPDFLIEKEGFSRWYTESVYEGKINSLFNIKRKEKIKIKKPLIAYNIFKSTNDIKDVICIDAVDCSRVAIQSIVDLYSVVQYSELFLDIKNEINSSSMLNPYAERVACKVYDPWYKTKASLFGFATDIAQAGISAVTPGLVYGEFDLQPGSVTSFNQLVKDGKITVNPKYNKTKVLSSVALDLGAMSNIPCSISISKSKKLDPAGLIGFRGLTIKQCRENEENVLNVDVKNELGENINKYYNGCVQCSLDFEHVSSAISSAIPYGRTAFFMARAIIRLYRGLKDPMNVPRSWSVNPYLTQMAFDSNGGKIPSDCVAKLIKGKSCMKNSCEDNIFNSLVNAGINIESVNATDSWRGEAFVKIKDCQNPISIRVNSSRNANGEESCVLNKKNLNLKCEQR